MMSTTNDVDIIDALRDLHNLVQGTSVAVGRTKSTSRVNKAVPGVQAQLDLLSEIIENILQREGPPFTDRDKNSRLTLTIAEIHLEVMGLQRLVEKVGSTNTNKASGLFKRAKCAMTGYDKQFREREYHLDNLRATLQTWLSELPFQSNESNHSNQKMQLRKILRPQETDFIPRRLPGTLEWIWTHETFQRWIAVPKKTTPLLHGGRATMPLNLLDRLCLIYGEKGCGKSVMASYIVEGLKEQENTALFFSFWSGHGEDRRAETMLRTLLWQLLESLPGDQQNLLLPEILGDQMNLRHPNLLALAIQNLAEDYQSEIYCVLDNIDESAEDWNSANESPLDLLVELLQDCPNLHILLFGTESNLCVPLQRWPLQIQLTRDVLQNDCTKLISSELDNCPNVKDEADRDRIQVQLGSKPTATFLWIKLIFDELRSSFSPLQLSDELWNLPTDLDRQYRRIFWRLMKRLSGWSNDISVDVIRAKGLLSLIAHASRPLTLMEIRLAYAFSYPQTSTESADCTKSLLSEYDVMYICGEFMVETKDRICLRHTSMKEFLVRPTDLWSGQDSAITYLRLEPRQCHRMMGLACLKYLQQVNWKSGNSSDDGDDLIGQYPLLNYASGYAVSHLLQSSLTVQEISTRIPQCLSPESFASWMEYSALAQSSETHHDPPSINIWVDIVQIWNEWVILGKSNDEYAIFFNRVKQESFRRYQSYKPNDHRALCLALLLTQISNNGNDIEERSMSDSSTVLEMVDVINIDMPMEKAMPGDGIPVDKSMDSHDIPITESIDNYETPVEETINIDEIPTEEPTGSDDIPVEKPMGKPMNCQDITTEDHPDNYGIPMQGPIVNHDITKGQIVDSHSIPIQDSMDNNDNSMEESMDNHDLITQMPIESDGIPMESPANNGGNVAHRVSKEVKPTHTKSSLQQLTLALPDINCSLKTISGGTGPFHPLIDPAEQTLKHMSFDSVILLANAIQNQRPKEALQLFQEALVKVGTKGEFFESWVHAQLGDCFMINTETKDKRLAEHHYRRSLELLQCISSDLFIDLMYGSIACCHAKCLLTLKRIDEAKATAFEAETRLSRKSTSTSDGNIQLYEDLTLSAYLFETKMTQILLLGKMYLNEGMNEAVERVLGPYTQFETDTIWLNHKCSTQLLEIYVLAMERLGKVDDARNTWIKLKNLLADSNDQHELLNYTTYKIACIYHSEGRFEDAEKELEEIDVTSFYIEEVQDTIECLLSTYSMLDNRAKMTQVLNNQMLAITSSFTKHKMPVNSDRRVVTRKLLKYGMFEESEAFIQTTLNSRQDFDDMEEIYLYEALAFSQRLQVDKPKRTDSYYQYLCCIELMKALFPKRRATRLHIGLGMSCLSSGRREEATKAFDVAAESCQFHSCGSSCILIMYHLFYSALARQQERNVITAMLLFYQTHLAIEEWFPTCRHVEADYEVHLLSIASYMCLAEIFDGCGIPFQGDDHRRRALEVLQREFQHALDPTRAPFAKDFDAQIWKWSRYYEEYITARSEGKIGQEVRCEMFPFEVYWPTLGGGGKFNLLSC